MVGLEAIEKILVEGGTDEAIRLLDEYISSAPVPDLVTDVKQYKTICRWWEKLSDTRRLKVAAMFANELGPIYGHDTETLERIYSRWFLLSLDGKQRIYHSWTTNEKQTSPCHTKARE